jgi:hypothetical protein
MATELKQKETKAKGAAPRSGNATRAESIAEQKRAAFRSLILGSELAIRRVAAYVKADGGYRPVLDPEDAALLRTAGLGAVVDDVHKLRVELGRIDREETLAGLAGKPEAYAAAQQQAAAAEDAERKRGPILDDQIAQLQVERAELLEAVDASRQRLNVMNSARQDLRSMAPEFIKGKVEFQKRQIHLQQWDEIATVQNRIELVEQATRIDPEREGLSAAGLAEANGRDDLVLDRRASNPISGFDPAGVDAARWQQWVEDLNKELPAVIRRRAELQEAYDAAMLAAEKPLDDFVSAAAADVNWIQHFNLDPAEE